MSMTHADIARLRALLQAATSQPWRTANGKRSASVVTDGPGRCAIYVNADRYGDMECSVPRWQADAALIAAAVNALGPLLDEVERLRASADVVKAACDWRDSDDGDAHLEDGAECCALYRAVNAYRETNGDGQ